MSRASRGSSGRLNGLAQAGWAYRRFQEAVERQLGDAVRGRRVAIYGSGLSGQLLATTLESLGATLALVVDGSAPRHGALVCGLRVQPVDALATPGLGLEAVLLAASLPAACVTMEANVRRLLGPGMPVHALTSLAFDGGTGMPARPGERWPSALPSPSPLPSDLRWMRAVARRNPLPAHVRVVIADGPPAAKRRTLGSLRAQWHRGWSVGDEHGTVLGGRVAKGAQPRLRVRCDAGTVLPPWALHEWVVQSMLWPASLPMKVACPQGPGGPDALVDVARVRGRSALAAPAEPLSFGRVHAPGSPWPRVAGRRALPVILSRAPLVLLDPDSIKRILLIKLDHVGDVVLSLPVFDEVRARFPRAEICVITASWTTPLLEELLRSRGVVDRVVTFDVFHEVSGEGRRPAEATLAARLRDLLGTPPFDVAIDLRRHDDARDVLQAVDARVKVAFGEADAFEQLGLPSFGMEARTHVPVHTVDQLRWLVDAALGPQPLDPPATLPPPTSRRRLMPRALHRRRWLVALAPGSGDQLRMWPAASYGALAARLVRELGAGVALVGSAAEAPLMARVIAAADTPHVVSMTGRLSLTEFRVAVREAHLFIGNTTGPTHIAAASGVSTLNVFSGQVSPVEWAPRGPDAFVLWTRPSCAPCYLPAGACPYSRTCLTSITPDHAFEAARRILLARYGSLQRGPGAS